MTKAETEQAEQIARTIHPLLAGHIPEIQGAVLADLVATFIAGYRPAELGDDILALHMETVRALVSIERMKARPDAEWKYGEGLTYPTPDMRK